MPQFPRNPEVTGTAENLEDSSHENLPEILSNSNAESHIAGDEDVGEFDSGHSGNLLREEVTALFPRVWEDAKGITNWNNGLILGVSLAGAIGIRQGLDHDVRENTSRHPERWGDGSKAIGRLGEAQYQAAGLLLYRAVALRSEDEFHQNLSRSLLSAFTIAGVTTLSVKAIANTDRPTDKLNGGQFGFPSYHSASSFAIASVLGEYYGPKVGIPALTVAGLIGWSRIDERDHDLSDVVFGAALGYVIGKSVAGLHLRNDSRVRLSPFTHPYEPAAGVSLEVNY